VIVKKEIEAKQGQKIGQKMFIRLGIEKRLAEIAGIPCFAEWQMQNGKN
jgi:hypothetical protein